VRSALEHPLCGFTQPHFVSPANAKAGKNGIYAFAFACSGCQNVANLERYATVPQGVS
jgi:hypothetical protein